MRPYIKYFGGKGRISNWIISNFPNDYQDLHYHELFFGGGSVFFAKKESKLETISEVDPDIFHAVAFLKNGKFKEIRSIEYNEKNFEIAKNNGFGPAISTIVKFRFSRSGLGKDFAWSDRTRGGKPGDVNAWENYLSSLEQYRDRLKNVTILNLSYKHTLNEYTNSFFYMDPPYLPSTRVTKKAYKFDWDSKDHIEFLNLVKDKKNKVLISGYDSDIYNTALSEWYGWHKVEKEVANNSGQNKVKNKRVEILWRNYEI